MLETARERGYFGTESSGLVGAYLWREWSGPVQRLCASGGRAGGLRHRCRDDLSKRASPRLVPMTSTSNDDVNCRIFMWRWVVLVMASQCSWLSSPLSLYES